MAVDADAFTAFERTAHDRIAPEYAEHFAPLTALALESLLNAAEISVGRTVLDVATGPGLAAAAAASRGALVIGIDVSPGMILVASNLHPSIDFRVGAVTALPFPDGSSERVICNFGLGHFPDPEAALAECVRVLAPGGALAFSWWDHPDRQRVQGLFREVIAEVGLPPALEAPQGHDMLRFSDRDVFASLLREGGLDTVSVVGHQTTYRFRSANDLWRAGMGGMVVTAGAIAAQPPDVREQARAVLARRAEEYRGRGGLQIPISYLVGCGRKAS